MKVCRVRIEHMKNPLGIDTENPLVSWNVKGGEKQGRYRIIAEGNLGTVYDSGIVEGSEMQQRLPAAFHSREQVAVTVFAYGGENEEHADPGHACFEMGISRDDWMAQWINLEQKLLPKDGMRPASYLRKHFCISLMDGQRNSARLYATAHGIYNIYLNGKHVDGFVMAPGTSEYKKILQYQTYDVTEYLKDGENEFLAILGNGWWRGTVTYDGIRNAFGDDISLLAQLEYNGEPVCLTDGTWEATQDGPLRDTDNMC